MSYQAIQAETIKFRGHNDDEGEAYYARPPAGTRSGRGRDPPHARLGRVDQGGGAEARPPRLLPRSPRTSSPATGPASPDDVAAARAAGRRRLRRPGDGRRRRPAWSTCAPAVRQRQGRRDRLLLRRTSDLSRRLHAARHRRRRRLLGRPRIVDDPKRLSPQRAGRRRSTTPRSWPARCSASSATTTPIPTADQVNRTEAELKKHGKTYEFHRYDGAGHGFFASTGRAYRPEQAVDGWQKVFAFFDKHLVAAAGQSAAA